jgi:Ca-activated chloride channel family protein
MNVALRSGARLDRDVVVRWPVATDEARAAVSVARPPAAHTHAEHAYGLLTIVPPEGAMERADVPRDLVLLIDTSGSMHGEPLAQARRVCLALVDSLGEDDQLEMIEFSWKPTRWKRRPVAATNTNKKAARKWLAALDANGGTEMRDGIVSALAPMRSDAQRQVVIISDGLIGFEQEILREIVDRLPKGSRVHTVGVGSAVNRSLTAPAARAGRGVEAVVGIGEDAERAAARLVAHTAAPVVVELELEGDAVAQHAPERLPDLMAGAPALVALRLDPAGGEIVVRGRAGEDTWEQRVAVPAAGEPGEGHASLAPLFARERVEDLEIGRSIGQDVDEDVKRLGLDYQIATRLTSWVAISDDATVDPTSPTRRETMPHELPYGMSVQKLGLRGAYAVQSTTTGVLGRPLAMRSVAMPAPAAPPPPAAAGPMGPPPGGGAPPRDFDDDAAFGAMELEEAAPEPIDAPAAPPPPEQQAKGRGAPRRRSLRKRVADGVRRFLSRAELELQGTVLVLEDARLVVSVGLHIDVSWEPTAVVLELADGQEMKVHIIHELSTRPLHASSGQVLRLAMRWDGGELPAAPRRLRVKNGGDELTIAL